MSREAKSSVVATLTPSQWRALRFLADRDYGTPAEIGYAIAEDRSRRGKSGMVSQGAGRLGGKIASSLVKLGLAVHSSKRRGFPAYAITNPAKLIVKALADAPQAQRH
jgi:predicted transcriptional regulator with HTH domain